MSSNIINLSAQKIKNFVILAPSPVISFRITLLNKTEKTYSQFLFYSVQVSGLVEVTTADSNPKVNPTSRRWGGGARLSKMLKIN